MVRNIVVFGGSSHPSFSQLVCNQLGIPSGSCLLSKFSVGETRVEIKESVRNKDVYVLQSGSGAVNDNLMELLITISACKTASARKVGQTAVLPFFPYSRQSDVPYNKNGAPLSRASNGYSKMPFDCTSQTSLPNGANGLHKTTSTTHLVETSPHNHNRQQAWSSLSGQKPPKRSDTGDSNISDHSHRNRNISLTSMTNGSPHEDDVSSASSSSREKEVAFHPRPGYKQWVAQSGTLVADLLTCAGADHVITMDLHDPQYQGFFDIPVDNLHSRPILKRYIQQNIPNYQHAVVVSPDAGGAKRATAIADGLGMPFALIHKERRPTNISDRQNATMLLVGDVANRTAILIDDLADTSNTITRAAKLLKKEGATEVYALITHGVLSGDAIERINRSALDKLIVTNSVPQEEHERLCPKIVVLDVGHVFAEVWPILVIAKMATQTTTQTASQQPSKITVTTSSSSSSNNSNIPGGPVTAPLNFYAPPSDGSKPYNYVETPPTGQPQRNFSDTQVPITINDIRGQESCFNLDDNAFAALQNVRESSERAFLDDASIKQKYYPEVEKLLLENVPGAKRILLFDHTIRRADPTATRNPVTRVHIDQTAKSAEVRVRYHHLPRQHEADDLLKDRVRIINVWRPLNGAVESFPLAFADSRSVPDDALVGIEHRYPNRNGETAAVKPTLGQRWFYWSGINDSERLLLQCYDSLKGARVPHTAFDDPRSTLDSKPRESIEVRAAETIRYHVPNTKTLIYFTDFGPLLDTASAHGLLRNAIANVQQVISTGQGNQHIAGGAFNYFFESVVIRIVDYSRRIDLPQRSVTNQILLDDLRGVQEYMSEEMGGYFSAVFIVATLMEDGKEEDVANGLLVRRRGNRVSGFKRIAEA
ncbi:MAG: hypothetical protein Q9217_004152 [Psora testacea]